MTKKEHLFQTETKQILDLVIHSLYSHREIFLRELISNSSDAIQKLHFESLTNPQLKEYTGKEFSIRLIPHKEQKTLSISDNGIGMSEEEMIKNLGTIAHSGTKAFLSAYQNGLKPSAEMIGQFGVGFYSSFMVANKVTVISQKVGATQAVKWESQADGSYTIEIVDSRPEGHGTTVILHLKDESRDEEKNEPSDSEHFTDLAVLRNLVKKYSDYIQFPIKMSVDKTADGKPEVIDEVLNSQVALWLKPASEITEKEYTDFYQSLSYDWKDPLKTLHFKAEGVSEFSALLYIPSRRAEDFYFKDKKHGLSLYVKRVFIASDFEELIPRCLRFLVGVVDSEDLSLNISRETLQHNHQVMRIRKALTSKVLSTLKDLLEKDRSTYEKFWESFGTVLKEGVEGASQQNIDKQKLLDLMLFTNLEDKMITLKEYVLAMKPHQKHIYYITGENLSQLKNSPYLEKVKSKGFDVLFLTDRIDIWFLSHLSDYDQKTFQSITSNDLDLSTSEEEKQKEQQQKQEVEGKLKGLIEVMRSTLSSFVKEVRISDRLTDSAVCLVRVGPYDAHTERLIESMGQKIPKSEKILEINGSHPLFAKMILLPEGTQRRWTDILYHQALLEEGSMLDNPKEYSQKITDLLLS